MIVSGKVIGIKQKHNKGSGDARDARRFMKM